MTTSKNITHSTEKIEMRKIQVKTSKKQVNKGPKWLFKGFKGHSSKIQVLKVLKVTLLPLTLAHTAVISFLYYQDVDIASNTNFTSSSNFKMSFSLGPKPGTLFRKVQMFLRFNAMSDYQNTAEAAISVLLIACTQHVYVVHRFQFSMMS